MALFFISVKWRKRSSSNNEGLVKKAETGKKVEMEQGGRDSKKSQEVDVVGRHDLTFEILNMVPGLPSKKRQ